MKFTAELSEEEAKALIELKEFTEGLKKGTDFCYVIKNEYVDKIIFPKGDVKDFIDKDLLNKFSLIDKENGLLREAFSKSEELRNELLKCVYVMLIVICSMIVFYAIKKYE